ncbi:TonB-dependent receptor [Hymenobacter sp. BT770]|uniref:TonB-dependent receptor domain-containing protein n=1 Tax=Hymenobacter sp. BT770 TaxID=2886942 RepID=UPI001D1089AF|nr:TonB-dependent receptor [Hymenobacter sp. BT770]MCC3151540.1 TonB-dependent receptor [Hymenobacter sp. BT770]MDO3413884.1 TonB-dependent receptor [Hymenobacter sp. BT770]
MTFLYRFALLGLPLAAIGSLPTPTAHAQTAPAALPAAPAATGSLTGQVLDSLTRKPVPYATVVLLPPAPNDKPITGVAADDNGRFSLTKLVAGPARLRISYVGYGTQTRPITITAGATDAGTFRLPTAGTALDEAVVIGTKPVVEVRPDRIIYNADQDVTNAGGTASDVLRKAPLLAVDGDGNVKMRGSSNFKVLVNNKPSPTLASNLAEALKGIPADQIKSVEIITTPPAKYDGEGTAGIINIVLKKGVDRGLNGRASASAGNRSSNLSGSLNFQKGKFGATSAFSAGVNNGPTLGLVDRIGFTSQGPTHLSQSSTGLRRGQSYYGTLGFDYDLNEYQSLSLAGSSYGYNGFNEGTLLNRFEAPNASPAVFIRATDSQYKNFNGELTGTYTRTFAQARREWSVLGQVARNSGHNDYDFDQFSNSEVALEPGLANYRERSRSRTPSLEVTAQTDFVQPLGEKQTIETGLKAIWRRTASVADVEGFTLGQTADFVPLPSRGTDFTYDQNVQSAYATYSFAASKKLNLSVGSRLERTAIAAQFHTTDTGFERSYLSLLPNTFAQYALSEASSMRLAYSRRITRPYIYYLNPYVNRNDPQNISTGNPNLKPELTDSYELSYNTNGKAGSLSVSGSMRRTGNAIQQVRTPTAEVGVTASTFDNVANEATYQLNFYGSVKPMPKWDVSGGPNVEYVVRRSPTLGIERRGFSASLNLNTSYKLPKSFTVQAFFYGSLPSPELQGRDLGYVYSSLGVKKLLFKDKADLTVNVSNPFNRYTAYGSTLSTAFLEERQEYRSYQRGFRVSFGYRFGQEKQGKRRKSISNDDVKGGSSKQGG